jgi:maltooligosyltrehalose trehalohydrolase
MRREDPAFRAQRPRAVDGAVLGNETFVLRYFGGSGNDRLLLINLGADLHFDPAPEPLLAPPEGRVWDVCWSTESPQYGGSGTADMERGADWRIPAYAAIVMHPVEPGENG